MVQDVIAGLCCKQAVPNHERKVAVRTGIAARNLPPPPSTSLPPSPLTFIASRRQAASQAGGASGRQAEGGRGGGGSVTAVAVGVEEEEGGREAAINCREGARHSEGDDGCSNHCQMTQQ